MKDLAEIASVQPARPGDVFYRNIILKVFLNKYQGFMNIIISELIARSYLHGSGRASQRVQKQITMSDEMKGRLIFVVDDIKHFLHQCLPHLFGICSVNRRVRRQPGNGESLFYTKPVKFQPHIFPGKLLIGNVGVDLSGKDHKALPAFDGIFPGDAFRIARHKLSGPGNDIVEQKVGPGSRAIVMGRGAMLLSELIQPQVYKVFIREDRKQ